ncbi:MAG: AAA family ATPase [Pirellulales bacterium]|nr:AAA family ATPase [Pirellulales bacterium]
MYFNFYGLSGHPFVAAPLAESYFPTGTAEQARHTLERCLDRAEGVALLIGPAGTGKSLLLQVLAAQLGDRYEVALLPGGRICTRRALLQAILFALRLPVASRDEGDLRLELWEHLTRQQRALLLLIDEAHTLPLRLLEELRLLSNFVLQGNYQVRILLAGSPSLEERFANPKLEALQQRVTARCYLQAWNRSECREYIRAQIHRTGGVPEHLFTSDALDAIQSAAEGIPRLINQLCDHALVLGFANGRAPLAKQDIAEAWAEHQQLPTPHNIGIVAAPTRAEATAFVEFGELSDAFGDANQPEDEYEGVLSLPSQSSDFHLPDDVSQDFHPPRLFDGDSPEEESLQTEFSTTEPLISGTGPAARRTAPPRVTWHAPGKDPAPASATDALTQLERAHLQVQQLQNEYYRSLPDPEADMSHPAHPFAEAFLEEEIVLDPFLQNSLAILADKPRVNNRQSQEISQGLERHLQLQAPLSVTVHTTEPSSRQVLPMPTAIPPEAVHPPHIHECGSGLGTSQIQTFEDDLIVIEDDPRQPAHTRVRRQDYKQLFARLRNGQS